MDKKLIKKAKKVFNDAIDMLNSLDEDDWEDKDLKQLYNDLAVYFI